MGSVKKEVSKPLNALTFFIVDTSAQVVEAACFLSKWLKFMKSRRSARVVGKGRAPSLVQKSVKSLIL